MFEVRRKTYDCGGNYFIVEVGTHNYMHRDGEVVPNCTERWPTREQAQAVLDKHRPVQLMNPLVGKTVVVYDRYHFALPLKGRIEAVAEKDGAFKVSFYSKQHGYPNYLKMDHRYFFSEQCQVVGDDPQPTRPPHVWVHGMCLRTVQAL